MDVVEWSRALDVRLSEWCCNVSMVWVQIPSRENKNLTALKSNSNMFGLIGLIFRRIYIYYIYVYYRYTKVVLKVVLYFSSKYWPSSVQQLKGVVVVVSVWWLDLQLPMQSVPITTKAVSSNPVHDEVYSIQHYDTALCDKDCKWLVTDRWFSPGTPVSSTNKTYHNDIAEILLKVALNTINQSK